MLVNFKYGGRQLLTNPGGEDPFRYNPGPYRRVPCDFLYWEKYYEGGGMRFSIIGDQTGDLINGN